MSAPVVSPEKPTSKPVVYQHGVVAADHPLASAAGIEMLKKGGNVVDAAVAASFTLSVVRPASCGIGGGGFMVIYDAQKKESVALDYRERAPLKATRDMYQAGGTEVSRKGHLAVAVPGNVAGLCYAVEHYGKLKLADVLAPAIRLTKEGYIPDKHYHEIQTSSLKKFHKQKEYQKRFSVLYKKHLNNGRRFKQSERFYSPLTNVLQQIAKHGRDGFYKGAVAKAIVKESSLHGGIITMKDLAGYQPTVRKPIQGKWDNSEVLTMPPPSSGGIALIEMLNILSVYEQQQLKHPLEKLKHNSPAYLHLLAEAMKHAFADRAEFLGDADFVKVPVQRLINRQYGAKLAAEIDANQTKPLKAYGRYLPVTDSGTSHISVIDNKGNAVACTETINTTFGSFVVEPTFGIVLNNEMDDFAAIPGKPNVFGLMQSEANAVAPRKRPLSSMTPTIVVRDGKAIYAVGASGGPKIISATFQVLLNMSRFGMPPTIALKQSRIHHQWLPNHLFIEEPLCAKVREALTAKGHQVKRRNNIAASQAVMRNQTGLYGASDRRKHGVALGW